METASASATASPQPNIDIRGVPAVIEWTAGEQHRCLGTSLSSTPAFFDIDFDASTGTASFRPRIALFRRHSDRPVHVYLVIKPKEVQSIGLCEPPQASDAVRGPRHNTIHLLFRLHSPATLVVPPDPMRLNNNAQAATFRLVRSAAQQTTLSIYLQADVLSQAQLKALCDADYQSFGPSRRHVDLGTLYGGRGGKVIEPAAADEAPTESPPSYNELEAPPPAPPVSYDGSDTASSSKKRRRSSSPSKDGVLDLSLVETICRKMICASHETIQSELSNMEARIMEHVDQHLDDHARGLGETRQAQIEKLQGQIQELKRDVRTLDEALRRDVKKFEAKTTEFQDEFSELDERFQGELEALDERIQEVSDGVDTRVDMEVEDRVLGIKQDLEEFVKDELKNTEDTIKERLAVASWSLQFDE